MAFQLEVLTEIIYSELMATQAESRIIGEKKSPCGWNRKQEIRQSIFINEVLGQIHCGVSSRLSQLSRPRHVLGLSMGSQPWGSQIGKWWF